MSRLINCINQVINLLPPMFFNKPGILTKPITVRNVLGYPRAPVSSAPTTGYRNKVSANFR